MAYNYEYPYTDPTRYNADWILQRIKDLTEDMRVFASINEIKYADPFEWSIARNYEQNTLTQDENGETYLSKKPVPVGIPISDSNYWLKVADFSRLADDIRKSIAEANDGTSTTTTEARTTGELVWLNGFLYVVLRDMNIGDAYIIGSNVEQTTIEEETTAKFLTAIDLNSITVHGIITAPENLEIDSHGTLSIEADDTMSVNVGGNYSEVTAGNKNIGINGTKTETIAGASTFGASTEIRNISGLQVTNAGGEMHNITNTAKYKKGDITIDIFEHGYKNVQEYGAKGDGVTDDTNAINNALADGGVVLFPKGDYVCASLAVKSNTTLIGNGAKLIRKGNAPLFGMFATTSSQSWKQITFNGLEMTAQNGSVGSLVTIGQLASIQTLNVHNITFENCYIHDVNGRAFDCFFGDASSFRNHPYGHLYFINCEIGNITNGIGICLSSCTANIENCYIHDTGLESITIDNGCMNVVVNGCTLVNALDGYGTIGSGVEGEHIEITNNNIYGNNTMPCIALGDGAGDYIGFAITGNTLTGGTFGVLFNSGNNMFGSITGNTIINQSNSALQCVGNVGGTHVSFIGNITNVFGDEWKLNALKYLELHDISLRIKLAQYFNQGFEDTNDRSLLYINGKHLNLLLYNCHKTTGTFAQGDIPLVLPEMKCITRDCECYFAVGIEGILRANRGVQLYGSHIGDYQSNLFMSLQFDY